MTTNNEERLLAGIVAGLEETEEPQLKSPSEALAASLHAVALNSGFTLTGINGDRLSESSRARPKVLPSSWNLFNSHRSPISFDYTLQPREDEAAQHFSLQVTLLGTAKALVTGLAKPDASSAEERTAVMETSFAEWFASDVFPLKYSHSEIESRTSQLKAVFCSGDSLSKLDAQFKKSVIDVLFPSLSLPEEAEEAEEEHRPSGAPPRGGPRNPPTSSQPLPRSGIPNIPEAPSTTVPFPGGEPMPGFEDEFQLQQPAGSGFAPPPEGGFPSLGSRDLYPPGFGPNDPFPNSGGPPLRGGMSGGGMHPTFDDPLFQGQRSGPPGPPGSHPPGARFDPVLPFGSPQDERMGGFPSGGRSRGFPGGGPNFGGGGFGRGFGGGLGGGGGFR